MTIEPFSKENLPLINEWLVARHLPCWEEAYIPSIGVLAFEEGLPVAAGFIRHCEGNVAILDSFITNPIAIARYRDRALNKITEVLISTARKEGYGHLMAFSSESCIVDRAKVNGLKVLPDIVMSMKL